MMLSWFNELADLAALLLILLNTYLLAMDETSIAAMIVIVPIILSIQFLVEFGVMREPTSALMLGYFFNRDGAHRIMT